MRVIAGSARRLLLKTPEGLETRPTSDRTKETLFNILQNDLYDCRFLDLFSGSGAIGIEALSRGAESAVFVEKGSVQIDCIRENLRTTKLADRARVMSSDVFSALKILESEKKHFDMVFMDPPYNMDLERKVMEALKDSTLVDEDTLFVMEASLETDVSWLEGAGYRLVRSKEYKTNKHLFVMKVTNE